jgi:prepilin-type N-terminal cleavage/methylation domain-containing protein
LSFHKEYPAKIQQGFSLVEIAIVLVIIGLLIGAVFKGQELIERAKYKMTHAKLEELTASIYTFLDKYGQYPGDAAGIDFDGDGTDDDAQHPKDGQIENGDFWKQMHLSGFLQGSGTEPVLSPFGTPFAVKYNAAGLGDNAVCVKLPQELAIEMDTRYDDGKGDTGQLRAARNIHNNADEPMAREKAYDPSKPDEPVWVCQQHASKAITIGN